MLSAAETEAGPTPCRPSPVPTAELGLSGPRSLHDAGEPVGSLRLGATDHPGTKYCVARRATHASRGAIRAPENIPLYRNSETAYVSRQPGPWKRGVSRSSRRGPGGGGRGPHRREGFCRAGNREQSVAQTTGVIRVRQNRVVLAPGVCASRLVVMRVAQPGPRVSHLRADGGNSASLPGEITT